MFLLCLYYVIVLCIIHVDHIQSQSIEWQSFVRLTDLGLEFAAIYRQALLLIEIKYNSLQLCTQACHKNSACRTFDYDTQSLSCRLFEGDIGNTGYILSSNSSFSIFGSIELVPYLFSNQGQPCSVCIGSRYLTCVNGTCQCPFNTYFDGSVCQSSQYTLGAFCEDSSWCRIDFGFTCLPRKQCSPLWLQNGTTIGGTAPSGSSLTSLNTPWGISVAADGTLFVGDQLNNRVIRFQEGSLTGTVVVGTNGSGSNPNQLNCPTSVVIDPAFNLYVNDKFNSRVMLWCNGSSSGTQVAGSGVIGSTSNTLQYPDGLAVDSLRNIYVSDSGNSRVMKWPPNATKGTIVAGTGIQGSDNQHLERQANSFLDELHSYLYVADQFNNRIVRYTLGSLTGTVIAGENGPGPANNQFLYPAGIYVSKKTGDIYVSEFSNHRIQRWSPGTTFGVTIAGAVGVSGLRSDLLKAPSSIALSVNETFLYVVDSGNHHIQRFQLI